MCTWWCARSGLKMVSWPSGNAVSLWFFEAVSESGGSCVVGPSLSPRSREHED